jgi:hypothetical protein
MSDKEQVISSFISLKAYAPSFSHADLCQIAAKWLRTKCPKKCSVVLIELVAQGSIETPDAIGFTSEHSILIECKTSRSDFIADKKKFFRIYPEQGVGDFRFYLSPENIIKPEDVPAKWGLIWVDQQGRCRQVKKIITSNILSIQENRFSEKNERSERALLYSALRRKQVIA